MNKMKGRKWRRRRYDKLGSRSVCSKEDGGFEDHRTDAYHGIFRVKQVLKVHKR
jgi:hypothetical protein